MLQLLVSGGMDEESPSSGAAIEEFAQALGKEIVVQGHALLNCARTSLDKVVAASAVEAATSLSKNPGEYVISYVTTGQTPTHEYGNVLMSQLTDWELGNPGLRVPEPIDLCDAMILMGGFKGTHRAANWARIAGKPILPITRFGGAATEIYAEELKGSPEKYGSRLLKGQFQDLAQLTSHSSDFAKTVVNLAERIRVATSVVAIMSFSEDAALGDAYESFKEVCTELKYDCKRVDDLAATERILPEILARIQASAFTIVDLSEERPNVYYELGYAEALRKPLIITAKKGTSIHFDAKDFPVIFWDSQKGLKEQLRRKIQAIASKQGR